MPVRSICASTGMSDRSRVSYTVVTRSATRRGFQEPVQPQGDIGILGGIVGRLRKVHLGEADLRFALAADIAVFDVAVLEMEPGQLVHAVLVPAGVADVTEQHGIVDRRDPDAVAGHDDRIVFDIVADLEGRRVLQQLPEHRQRTLERNLLWRRCLLEVQRLAAARSRRNMGERHIAGVPRLDRQREADQFGAHLVQ